MFLKVDNLEKTYGENENKVNVLKGVDFSVDEGEICVILGPSGSGKSTLLNAIGGIDSEISGSIIIDNNEIVNMKNNELQRYRRKYLGFVFQFYNLIANLTVKENIEVCSNISKNPMDVNELIDKVGLADHKNKFPKNLSGGQQQRVAIARALAKNPKLLLCDEPTGALDYKTSKEILGLLESVNKEFNTTMIIITHNAAIKDMANRVIKIKDGKVTENFKNEDVKRAADIDW